MPVPSSPIARLLPARRRPAARRVVGRFAGRPAARPAPAVPAPPAGRRSLPSAGWSWTLYSRWHWSVATARAERERRRSRPVSF